MRTVKYMDWDCKVVKSTYQQGGIALILFDKTTSETISVATVWIPGLAPDEIAIPEYKIEGMTKALQNAGIIDKQLRTQKSGYVNIPIFKYIPE